MEGLPSRTSVPTVCTPGLGSVCRDRSCHTFGHTWTCTGSCVQASVGLLQRVMPPRSALSATVALTALGGAVPVWLCEWGHSRQEAASGRGSPFVTLFLTCGKDGALASYWVKYRIFRLHLCLYSPNVASRKV